METETQRLPGWGRGCGRRLVGSGFLWGLMERFWSETEALRGTAGA